MIQQTTKLQKNYQLYKEKNPKAYLYRAAQDLDVSELDLLSLNLNENVFLLKPEFEDIFKEIRNFGKVMALTRNENAVHERKGIYKNFMAHPGAWLFVGKDIDLRIFPRAIKHVLAVKQIRRGKESYSIQFFNQKGLAIHKIFVSDESKFDAFNDFIEKFKAEIQEINIIGENPKTQKKEDAPLNTDQINEFKESWLTMTDSHQFFSLFNKYKMNRLQALENAPEGYSKKLTKKDLELLFDKFSKNNQEIMCFVGNNGIIQIHSGLAKNILYKDSWINIMDPDFNLHLNLDGVIDVYKVVKPSDDGNIHSIEVFDENKELIVQFFGKRKPGVPELKGWTEIVNSL